jgi:serine/threonine-protein kinase
VSEPLRDTVGTDTLVDGRYRVLNRIGSGGMADVYLAEDNQLGRRVALKVLHLRFAEDHEFVERFRREASAAAGLQHPNVVQVYDRGSWEGTSYIAMEFLEGRNLKQIIRERGILEPSLAVDIAVQILRAIRFAHKRGIIHRDIKPHNVIVDGEGRAKVTDFGIARAGASDMTETGAIMGTAQYLSPEQAQGHPISAAADIYSVGIVLYEMLTGRVPFEAESAVTIALKQVNEDPEAIRTINPEVSPELEDVVLRALRKDPRERYVDADEFIEALEGARDLPASTEIVQRTGRLTGIYPAAVEEGIYPAEPYDPLVEERRGLRFWLIVLAALVGLGALAYGAYVLLVPEKVRVPNVVRLQSDTAAAKLNNTGFEVEIQEVRSADIPRELVTRQRPGPGQLVEEGSTVTIFVSTGPGEATVPDVIDRTEREAVKLVRDRGFRVDVDREFSDTVEKGRVIESRPDPRTQLELGTTVTLVVSRGREDVAIPDVTALDRDGARSRLERLDLEVVFRETESSDEEPGQVLSQEPAAGTEVEKGSQVTVTVSVEPAEAEVPDVIGLSPNEASETLQQAGFIVRTREVSTRVPEEDDTVLRQDPPPGEQLEKGSRVTISVGEFDDSDVDPGDGPTPTPTPTPEPRR